MSVSVDLVKVCAARSGPVLFRPHLLSLHGSDPLSDFSGVVLDHRRALPGDRGNQIIAAASFQKLTGGVVAP